jgi:cob(I)alamin adenosyltransferase
MTPFYTAKGDSGHTGFLGKGRISKSSARIEAVGSVDEANAILGLARSLVESEEAQSILLQIQKKLYILMTEVSAIPDEDDQFNKITQNDVNWVESQIDHLEQKVTLPREFIIPGETCTGGVLAVARTIIRRAERRIIAYLNECDLQRTYLLSFINRLSSLIFILEAAEDSRGGDGRALRLAKEDSE